MACRKCGCEDQVRLSSQRVKICAQCGHTQPWELEPKEQPLISNNRRKNLTQTNTKP